MGDITGLIAPPGGGSGTFSTLINTAAVADQSTSLQIPVTSFSITIPNGCSTLYLNPAGTLAAGTITMPAAPIDKQVVEVGSSQIITALTVSANAGQTLLDAPTTIGTVGSGFAYIYNLATTTWLRLR